MLSPDGVGKTRLFSGLPDRELRQIASEMKEVEHAAGHQLATTGRSGIAFSVVLDGEVEVRTVDGRTRRLGPGDHFGEMALLDDSPRSASVVASERSELAILSRQTFFDLLRSNFSLTRALLSSFTRRLRQANSTIEGLAALDVKSRLARYFRELAKSRGRSAGGGWVVVVRPSQREIADTIGSSRETVSRTMSQMAQEDLIVAKGKVVYIKLEAPRPAAPGAAAAGAAQETAQAE